MAKRLRGAGKSMVRRRGLPLLLASSTLLASLYFASNAMATPYGEQVTPDGAGSEPTWWGLPIGVIAWLVVGCIGLAVGTVVACRTRGADDADSVATRPVPGQQAIPAAG